MVIGVVVVAVSAGALFVTRRSNADSRENLAASNSAFLTGTRFADDISSAGPVAAGVLPAGTDLISANIAACSGASAVLRLIGPRPDGTGVQVRSYHELVGPDGKSLQRRTCSGTTLANALGAAPSSSNIVAQELSVTPDAVTVACDGAPVSADCVVVDMTLLTATGRTFTVRGTIDSVLQPTATTTPLPVVAPPTGQCTIMASETTWGASGGLAGDEDETHAGDSVMRTYGAAFKSNSYMRFDLTQPCAGYGNDGGDSWPTLPGGRNLTSVTLKLAYMGKVGSGAGISKASQIMQPLDAGGTWSEATLKGANMPTSVRSGNDYKFDVSGSGSLTSHVGTGLIASVKQWYKPDGWENNGFILRRDGVGDTLGRSNTFASRSNSNTSLRPRLVITWG